eukprot:766751-Hanusia_phi.AAC.9
MLHFRTLHLTCLQLTELESAAKAEKIDLSFLLSLPVEEVERDFLSSVLMTASRWSELSTTVQAPLLSTPSPACCAASFSTPCFSDGRTGTYASSTWRIRGEPLRRART